jgi:hypothetical protein
MTLNKLNRIYHPKDEGTFKSARWVKDYTPDLSIVNRAPVNDNTMCNRYIIESFPRSQHRPMLLHYEIRVPLTESIENFARIFHLLIGSRLMQTSITLFDLSLLARIHTLQNVMYHMVFVRSTFQAGIRFVKICTKNIIPIMS